MIIVSRLNQIEIAVNFKINVILNGLEIVSALTLFRMSFLGAAQGWGAPKIRHTYPTVMKLGAVIPDLRKIKKMYKSHAHSLSSADISIFSPEISKVPTSRNTHIDWILMYNF